MVNESAAKPGSGKRIARKQPAAKPAAKPGASSGNRITGKQPHPTDRARVLVES